MSPLIDDASGSINGQEMLHDLARLANMLRNSQQTCAKAQEAECAREVALQSQVANDADSKDEELLLWLDAALLDLLWDDAFSSEV